MSDPPEVFPSMRRLQEILIWLLNSGRDELDRWWITISGQHHEIHEGNSYTYPFVDLDVDIAGPKYILLRTPDTTEMQHLTISVGADGVAIAELFENPTVNTVGDLRAFLNRNRRVPMNTANCLLYEDPTSGGDGTRLGYVQLGGAGVGQTKITGEASQRDEFILAQNQDYFIKVTVTADDTVVNIQPDIYEVTPA